MLVVGFADLTFAAVAAWLGVGQATLYRHAANRDELVRLGVDLALRRTEWPAGPRRTVEAAAGAVGGRLLAGLGAVPGRGRRGDPRGAPAVGRPAGRPGRGGPSWTAPTLLRVGGAVAFVGFVLLVPDAGAVPLFGAILLIGLGLGTAMPGHTAGPTLLVERDEQGGLAGLTTATTGLTFVVAPTGGTALYGVRTSLPIVVGAVVMAAVTAFVLLHPRFRRVPAVPVAEV